MCEILKYIFFTEIFFFGFKEKKTVIRIAEKEHGSLAKRQTNSKK